MGDYKIDLNVVEIIKELIDYFESRITSEELELWMWHKIGEYLSVKDEQEIEQFAKIIQRPLSEVRAAIEFYKAYPIFWDFNTSMPWLLVKNKFEFKDKNREMTKDEIKKKIEEVITIEGEREGNFVNYYFALTNEQIDELVDFIFKLLEAKNE